jgi:signal transduction histidine kinase
MEPLFSRQVGKWMKVKPILLNLALVGITAVALSASVAVRLVWPEQRWLYEPLHSAMEALGGLAAIVMAFVLLQRKHEPGGGKFGLLAIGFLGMGLLEEFHAVAPLGIGLVLLRSVASLIGGIGFALVWLPDADKERAWVRWMPWVVAMGCLTLGLWTLASPERVLQSMHNGEFTATAIAPKSLACMLFLAGAVRFLREFQRSRKSEDYLFACLGLLFGTAELMFTYSAVWDSAWWFWHGLRVLTYFLVLGYVSRGYLQIVSELTGTLTQARRAEEGLRQALEEREQFARDLHDGLIQSIYAIGLSLAECRRLIAKDAQQAVKQLGDAIADLNTVIRDARNFIEGLEPEIVNGKEFEPALASLVHTMEGAHTLEFRLQVDQTAADRLTPPQATHLLYIAKEAMSNSLRHSHARNVVVSLRLESGYVRLAVEDDGTGFDPGGTAEQGHGLRNIQARAQALNARCEVSSLPGQGTRLVLEVPLEAAHATA